MYVKELSKDDFLEMYNNGARAPIQKERLKRIVNLYWCCLRLNSSGSIYPKDAPPLNLPDDLAFLDVYDKRFDLFNVYLVFIRNGITYGLHVQTFGIV